MTDTAERLSLYRFNGCPWCERVRTAIDDLGIAVEERDVRKSPAHAAALREAMGRGTVPVLRIDDGDQTRWIPESADIVAHLYERYGQGRAPTWLASGRPQRVGAALAAILAVAAFAAPVPWRWVLLAVALVVWVARNYLPLLRLVLRR